MLPAWARNGGIASVGPGSCVLARDPPVGYLEAVIDLWAQKASLRDVADAAHAASRRGEHRWLKTVPGGGRHFLFHQLVRHENVIGIELIGTRYLDAPLHFLTQLTRAVGESRVGAGIVSGDDAVLNALEARARSLADNARSMGRTLALLLPLEWPVTHEWRDVGEDAFDEGERARLRRLRAVLQGVRDSGISVIVVSSYRAAHPWRSEPSVQVARPVIGHSNLSAVDAPELASAVAGAARALRDAGLETTPIEARALVGLAALGVPAARVVKDPPKQWIPRFAQEVAGAASLIRGARVLVHARRSLRRDRLGSLLGPEGFERRVLTECVAYGDQEIRVPEPLQVALKEYLPSGSDDETAHVALSEYHRLLDGCSSPSNLAREEVVHWLEKLHHLAHGGASTEAQWQAQDKLDREHYWARARHLSKFAHRYHDASELYRQCLDQFGADSYTEHYLGFNLDRDRAAPDLVRPHYERAVELDRANPWWNSRLVTFLIGHGTLDEARKAWSNALVELDPDGSRMEESSWLAMHLHRWVARRWLALGYVAEARGVLEGIPRRWIESDERLRSVEHLVRDAEEGLQLGESVYPAGVPVDSRWKGPRVTPTLNASGASRTRWWPGRVLRVEADDVIVILADPESLTAYRVSYTADEWRAMANQAPSDARGFIELAEYVDGSRQIRVVPEVPVPSFADDLRDVIERLET